LTEAFEFTPADTKVNDVDSFKAQTKKSRGDGERRLHRMKGGPGERLHGSREAILVKCRAPALALSFDSTPAAEARRHHARGLRFT
jgi:hypothetical protein